MSFFISDAMAQDASTAATGGGIGSFVMLIIMFVFFYFILLRPQIKRAKEHKKMTEAIAKNDEVVTTGGIAGRVTKVEETFVMLQVAEGVQLQVQKNAVGSLLPKGSLKI